MARKNTVRRYPPVDYYASCGWVYVDTVMKLYRIYRADDPETEELHTDPVVLAAFLPAPPGGLLGIRTCV